MHLKALHGIVLHLVFLATGCGDDGLSKSFVPKDPPPEEKTDLGPPSPISAGFVRGYQMVHSYTPMVSNSCGGLTCEERSSLGFMCIKLDAVQDHATASYKDAGETVLVGRARVWGLSSSERDIYITYLTQSSSPPAEADEPAIVDATHVNLWLKQLTITDSRAHPYLAPQQRTFETRGGPYPPFASLTTLPFFEVRESVVDETWGGWDAEIPQGAPKNFVGQLDAYFRATFGDAFVTSDDYGSHSLKPSEAASNNLYTLEVVWRERHDAPTRAGLSEPTELSGRDLVHGLRFSYEADGVLTRAEETVLPDLSPTADISSLAFDTLTCVDGEPCATAYFDRHSDGEHPYCDF